MPDGDTIGRFRNILIKNGIQEKFFALIVKKLMEEKLILKKGTIVDSTFIEAPSSTKNQEKKRDPDGKSGKKGNTWHFGYKAHIGVDKDSGIAHTVEVTGANESEVNMTPKRMNGEEEGLWGDAGYVGAEKREDVPKSNKNGKRIRFHINLRKNSSKNRALRHKMLAAKLQPKPQAEAVKRPRLQPRAMPKKQLLQKIKEKGRASGPFPFLHTTNFTCRVRRTSRSPFRPA